MQYLGAMTNRIIEIQEQMKIIDNLATRVLEEDGSLLIVNLEFSTREDVINEIDNYLRLIFIKEGKLTASELTIENITKKVASIRLTDKYQMIVFEGIIAALKQEELDLSAEIKIKTGNL